MESNRKLDVSFSLTAVMDKNTNSRSSDQSQASSCQTNQTAGSNGGGAVCETAGSRSPLSGGRSSSVSERAQSVFRLWPPVKLWEGLSSWVPKANHQSPWSGFGIAQRDIPAEIKERLPYRMSYLEPLKLKKYKITFIDQEFRQLRKVSLWCWGKHGVQL